MVINIEKIIMDRKQNAKRILFWSILILAVALMYFVAEKLFDKKIAFIAMVLTPGQCHYIHEGGDGESTQHAL